MTIAKVEVDRFSITCSKPFESVVAALKSAVGQPDIVEFFKATSAAKSFPDLERVVQSAVGRTGLMLFAEFELGAVLRRETGLETPKIIRFLVGNPLCWLLRHRSQSLSMNVPTARTSPMTKWRSPASLRQLGRSCRRPKS